MSTIMKKPLIETIMDNLDGDTLVKLRSDIDSDTGYSEYNLLERYLPQLGEGETSLAVRATLITNGETLVGSYIKYSSLGETHSYLLNYGRGVHKVYIYEINEEKRTTYLVGECLGVSELRRVIVDRLIEQGANDIPIHKNENGSYVFNEGLEVKSNGDVTVGKNLEVGGTTKLNGGLKPIHTYKLDGITTLYVYFEHLQYGEFIGYGWIMYIGTSRPCIFNYSLQDGKVTRFRGLGEDIIYDYRNGKMETFTVAREEKCQPKLYRHRITLRNASSADGTCMLEWISSNNLQCRSLEDLRTVLGNPQMQSYVASNPSGDLFGVIISTSTAQFKKAGTTSLVNITSVDDTVTAL